MSVVFFKPNTPFVKWILEYADGRLILDVGCGEGFPLTKQLIHAGAEQIVAIDQYLDYGEIDLYRNLNHNLFLDGKHSIHLIPGKVEIFKSLYSGDKPLLAIFARPCHSDFVEEFIRQKGPNVEVMYITKAENLELYDDLGEFADDATLIPHEGSSVDNEVVYIIE